MKRIALIAALFLAVAGVGFAQQDMGNVRSTGPSYTTGLVEANAVDSITIRDDGGKVVTFLIDDKTVGALGHAAGSRVRIDYHHNEQNQGIADVIQGVSTGEIASNAPEATVVTEPQMPEEPAVAQVEPAPAEVEVTETEVTEPAVTEPAAAPEPLPATASHRALLALIGSLSLGAALVVRFAR